MFSKSGPVLVIAPHPDDDVIGAGGTMRFLVERGYEICVHVCTVGEDALFGEGQPSTVRRELEAAHEVIGVRTLSWGTAPAARVDSVPHHDLNAELLEVLKRVEPDTVLLPHWADVHLDHRLLFDSMLVGLRPNRPNPPSLVLSYETASSSHWGAPGARAPFDPTFFVDISETLEAKIEAFGKIESQVYPYPHQRSFEAVRALARFRGSAMGMEAAEAFVVLRALVR